MQFGKGARNGPGEANTMDFMTFSSEGQAICAAHHLIICGQCCVDFTGPEFQQNDEEESSPDRVFVLGCGMNRFIPQWDEQVQGPGSLVRIKTNYESPPKPDQLPDSTLLSCNQCELTWLVGQAGRSAAASHPSHHTLSHVIAGTRRSLVVHTDGACVNNGQPAAKAGIGIYFGPNSKYNVSEQLSSATSTPTNQRAELQALLRAMQVVREEIVPARSVLVRGHTDTKHFRLVLVTDSSYAVECMCKHFKAWSLNMARNVIKNKQGKQIANSDLLLALYVEVENLSQVGVQVTYYHVDREFNQYADRLAKSSIGT